MNKRALGTISSSIVAFQYKKLGKSTVTLGERWGVSPGTIVATLHRSGVTVRPRGRQPKPRSFAHRVRTLLGV